MSTRIQVRRDSTLNWETTNPTLAAGEIGYDTTKKAFKIGDGTRTWTQITYQLPYLTGDAGTTPDVTTLVVDQDNDRVGIGTGTPTEKLSVTGNATVSGNIAAGGTLSVTGNTTLTGDLAVNGGDITTSSSTLNIANTITGTQTVNIAGGVTTTGNTKTVNLATGGATGSTTNINIGSSAGGTMAVLKNATVAGTLAVTGVISGPGTIPIGGIIMWSGSTVPTGWQLCDGSNSTPDLRNKMILGGNTYSTSAWRESITGSTTSTGGTKDAVNVSHTHTITDAGHRHNFVYDDNVPVGNLAAYDIQRPGNNLGGGAEGSGTTLLYTTSATATGIVINSAGVTGTNQNLPPYFVLAFIMRMT